VPEGLLGFLQLHFHPELPLLSKELK